MLGSILPLLLAAACLCLLATWIPHYLTWPWWNDHDHFGTFALAWRRGAPLPYRDLPSFQFPGEYYFFLALGGLFGWGRTAPLYAADAALVVAYGVALVAWARRRFDHLAPGLVGFLTFLFYYLNLGYDQAAQRDWHSTLLAVLALLAAESWRSRAGRLASAALMGLAFATRPFVVLLFPALLLALDEGARRPGESFARTLRAGVEWAAAFALTVALAFAPLLLQGLFGDFLRGLRLTAVGTEYNKLSWANVYPRFRSQLVDRPRLLIVPAAAVLLAAGLDRARFRTVATWSLALAGALLARPLSPRDHAYMTHVPMLVWSVSVALLAGLLLDLRRSAPALRFILLAFLLYRVLTPWPLYCSVSASWRSFATLARGEYPTVPPPCGSLQAQPWDAYCDTLTYLRQHAPPGTYVANLLPNVLAIDGPVAALPPMPGESLSWFIHYQKSPGPLTESYRLRLAASPPGSFAVWAPDGPEWGYPFPKPLGEVLLRDFAPVARFGPFEIRRRLPIP